MKLDTKEEYNKWFRDYRAKNREKMRAYNREYNRKWRQENGYHNESNSKKRYPLKQYARQVVGLAIRRGTLKSLPCIICGEKKTEAHHPDYLEPLKVIWFCKQHHIEFHRRPQELKVDKSA